MVKQEQASPDRRFNYVGEPISFEGYVDDLEHGVAAVQLSLDRGRSWTDFPTTGARSELGVRWSFSYTPKTSGHYELKARAVSGTGVPANTIESFAFDVLPAGASVWGSIALRPVGHGGLEHATLCRSRELTDITAQEALVLANRLGVRSVYDVRGSHEVATTPEPRLSGMRMLAVAPAEGTRRRDANKRLVAGVIGEYGAPGERMRHNYRRYASDYPLIGTVLRSIAAQGTPALVHCKNGKDRTGVLCAVAQRIAGFGRDEIMADYLQTNSVNAALVAQEEAQLSPGMTELEHEMLMSFLEAREEYLDAFFDEAAAQHGSFEAYVRDGLRLTGTQCAVIAQMLA